MTAKDLNRLHQIKKSTFITSHKIGGKLGLTDQSVNKVLQGDWKNPKVIKQTIVLCKKALKKDLADLERIESTIS